VQIELYLQESFYDSSPEKTVIFGDNDSRITAETWENWFNRWLEILDPDIPIAPGYEIGLLLCDDDEIQSLNLQYRHQDKPTDVLAFAALEADVPVNEEILASSPLYLGDIIVSIDTANNQAQKQKHPLKTELAWLASHGLLHLVGWDHPDEESLLRMLGQQVDLLKIVGIAINVE
jgi:probable rRNA maturation factor